MRFHFLWQSKPHSLCICRDVLVFTTLRFIILIIRSTVIWVCFIFQIMYAVSDLVPPAWMLIFSTPTLACFFCFSSSVIFILVYILCVYFTIGFLHCMLNILSKTFINPQVDLFSASSPSSLLLFFCLSYVFSFARQLRVVYLFILPDMRWMHTSNI